MILKMNASPAPPSVQPAFPSRFIRPERFSSASGAFITLLLVAAFSGCGGARPTAQPQPLVPAGSASPSSEKIEWRGPTTGYENTTSSQAGK